MATVEKLVTLRDYKVELNQLSLDVAAELHAAIPDDLRSVLHGIEDKYDKYADSLRGTIATIEAEIKAEVIAAGVTVKADGIKATYVKPRISWDGKALDGYAAAHPEIKQFRKIGSPSVRIG